jgi:hypothetical protein
MARRGVQALHVEGFLDGDRHTVKRPQFAALPRALTVGGPGGLHGTCTIDDDQRIQGAVQPVDALQMRLGRLLRTDAPVSYSAGKPRRRFKARMHVSLPCACSTP